MIDMKQLDKAFQVVSKALKGAQPTCGLILGSGWSEVVEAFDVKKVIPYEKIPGLGKTGVVGHVGRLVLAESSGVSTLIFQGRRHFYEGVGWTPIALPVYLMKRLGVKRVLVTNAAGGVRSDLLPGTLMVIRDHINMLGANPLIGAHDPFWGERFPDQTRIYKEDLSKLLHKAGRAVKNKLAEGVYLADSGPTYETPAEIQAFKKMGADAVGMSTVPEATLANAAGLRVAGLSCITNCAAGITGNALTHEEVTETTRNTMSRMKALIIQYWKELANAKV